MQAVTEKAKSVNSLIVTAAEAGLYRGKAIINCGYCSKKIESSQLVVCSDCKSAFYCNQNCLLVDSHSPKICAALSKDFEKHFKSIKYKIKHLRAK
jgi:hypothetical protein